MTVNEWLNSDSLGIDIWNKKYRKNDESLDDWFKRVSGGDEELEKRIREKKFLFGGRTLSNRGMLSGSLSNCFTGDAVVFTKRGLVPIKDVQIGDEVLTDKQRFRKVNDVFKRKYIGDLYQFTKSNLMYDTITCTPNHQFLTNRGWKRADRIFPFGVIYSGEGGDKLRTAYDAERIFRHAGEGEVIDFSTGYNTEIENKRLVITDNTLSIEKYCNFSHVKDKPAYRWAKFGSEINRFAVFDEDFAYFVGRWLGDGSITKRKENDNPSILQIVFNAEKEEKDADRCQEIGERIFGIKCSRRRTEQNIIAVRFENEIISTWFLHNFGEKCDGKYVPDKYLGNYQMLLGLFDSDGFLSTHGGFKIVLKNKKLIDWAHDTCYLNSINASPVKDIFERQPDTYEFTVGVAMSNGRLNADMSKTFFDKDKCNRNLADYIIVPEINILENQEVDVYNLSVEEDHTYTVNGIVVHNCYSSGKISDDLDSIMQASTEIAQTFKAQGGQGLSLSDIRPKGSKVGKFYQSEGIIPFMEIFNTVTASISQGGSRKGALMMSLDVEHPQIKDFITIKSDHDRINNANLSVEINDRFMVAVQKYYDTGEIVKYKVKSKYKGYDQDIEITPIEIYKLIMHHVWKDAEPGVMFMNEFSNYNLMEKVSDYQIFTSNPCGEQPLPKYGACNLSSINISEYVLNPFTENAIIDYSSLGRDMYIYVRGMDDIVTENSELHALEQQREFSRNYRNIGIGVMGLGDALIKMGIKYGSEESIHWLSDLMKFIFRNAVFASNKLALERGTFPKYDSCIFDSAIIKNAFSMEEIRELKKNGLRNASLISIAPTGLN